ncbi:MAG: hypothetical protein ABR548_01700 [Actinomycetota bacterium]
MVPLALTASNVVAGSTMGLYATTATANDVKPVDCSSITLTALYGGKDDVTAGSTNDLELGGPAAQTLNGGSGDDCILGGSGDDTLDGGPGSDVCIGGPGEDAFLNCETIIQGDPTP